MKDLLRSAAERAIHYLEGLDNRAVRPDPVAVARLKEFDIPFPEQPVEPSAVLAMLDELASPATMGMAGRRFFGFVIGGSLPGFAGSELDGRCVGSEQRALSSDAGDGTS